MITIRELRSVEDFHEFKSEKDGKIRIVKLMTSWCAPCRFLSETIRGLDSEKIGDSLFAEIDIDTDDTESVGFECGIRGVPVLIFYKNGEEIKRISGAVSADVIYKAIEELS